jgi:hypothetical protein
MKTIGQDKSKASLFYNDFVTLSGPHTWRPCQWLAIFLSVVVLTGCRVVEETARLPVKAVTVFVPGTKAPAQDLPLLQLELERYADDYMGRTTVAIDDYARIVGTPEARSQALLWKLRASSGVVLIATGPNPIANLVDMVTGATLARMTVEARAATSPQPAAFQQWSEATRVLETNAWKLAATILNPSQLEELGKAIQQWHEANPGALPYMARTEGLTDLLKRSDAAKGTTSGGLFNLVGLDPMAGLDPAVKEVTLMRLLAERALYMAQRMPFFLRLQLEALADEVANMPAVTQSLTNVTRLSRAVESASETAALLPGQIADERKVILSALDTQEGKLRGLTAEVREALVAGEKMSASLNTTILSFDALMKRFGVGEPPTGPPDTNSAPFNILDYGRTAGEITGTARALDELIKDLNQTMDAPGLSKGMQELSRISLQAQAEAHRMLNRAFLLAAGLVVLTFACALAWRFFFRRTAGNK